MYTAKGFALGLQGSTEVQRVMANEVRSNGPSGIGAKAFLETMGDG